MKDLKANKFFFGTLATFFLFGLFLLFFFGVVRLQAQVLQPDHRVALSGISVIGEASPLVQERLVQELLVAKSDAKQIRLDAIGHIGGSRKVIAGSRLLSAELLNRDVRSVLLPDLTLKPIEVLDLTRSLQAKALLQNDLKTLIPARLVEI